MAKLNFYDTDAVKAFVLDILIENAELKSDLDYEKKCSNDWFDRYKKNRICLRNTVFISKTCRNFKTHFR